MMETQRACQGSNALYPAVEAPDAVRFHRPEGTNCTGSLPGESLAPGTELTRVVREVPPRRSRPLRARRGGVPRPDLCVAALSLPSRFTGEAMATRVQADALPTDREPRHRREHAQRRPGQPGRVRRLALPAAL